MGALCTRCCGNGSHETDADSETQHLIVDPAQSYEATQQTFPDAPALNEEFHQPVGDVTDMMSDILKVVETQVVDAGVTDVNILEQQDYDARAEYYATQFSEKINIPNSTSALARASGNPSSILAGQLPPQSEIDEVQFIATKNAKLISEMYPQTTESFVVHLDSA
uniref:Late endosomal/lysosomal adaptor and MAPK and MTOR activator 1 n=1 Tax=Mesocestoides corti TaxID=53468 RepID=A0A5K3EK95_MESCO